MSRSNLWEVTSRTIVYAAIGAALYGVLSLFSFLLPGTTNVSIRPAFALVPFFGYAFGPIVGLFVGFVGNCIGDQLAGYGFLRTGTGASPTDSSASSPVLRRCTSRR
jgi:uncharacterized membrane protein